MTPATTMIVSTYGSAWKRTAPDSEKVGSRCAIALENPNRHAKASAPPGRHRPQMTTASAMYPRPAVRFWLNEPRKPIDRYAPPSAANPPEVMTAS